MQQNDRINAIIKVQLALNHLKLCADHENPMGGGVPVDIVAMPDFVVDIDGYAVTQLNQGKLTGRLAAAEVGSRAGRILSILAHLRDLDDEGFNLHYIAKTGAVGRAVLEKRLNTDLRKKHLQPLRFPFLVPAEDTRYAVLGREERKFVRKPQIIKNHTLLTRNDLTYHFYNPLDVIANASAVYFGTDSFEQLAELFELVLLGPDVNQSSPESHQTKRQRYVFLDLSGLQNHARSEAMKAYRRATDSLLSGAEEHKNPDSNIARTHLIVMVMIGDSSIDQYWQELKLRDRTDTLLVYDNETMCAVDRKRGNLHSVPLKYEQRPGPRDAFVAGFLLHRAIATAWQWIPDIKHMRHLYSESGESASEEEVMEWLGDWPQGLFPNPYNTTKADGWPLSEAVDFGHALACLWAEETDTIPDKRNLVFQNLGTADQGNWVVKTSKESTNLISSIKRALSFVREPVSEKTKHTPFFVYTTLLAKHWQEGKIPDDFAKDIRKTLLSLLNVDLTIQPKLWVEKRNERSHTLRLPSLATTRMQFVLDALRRMSMEERWRRARPTRACLLDLDGTLIQSSGLRRMCLRRAFLAMLYEDQETSVAGPNCTFPTIPGYLPVREKADWPVPDVPTILDRCERLYHYAIYNRWQDWQDLLGPYPYYAFGDLSKDFRQVWNHPLSYVVFTLVLEWYLNDKEFLCSPLSDSPAAVMIRACSQDCYPELERMLSKKRGEKHDTPTEKLLCPHREEMLPQDVAVQDQKHRKVFQSAVNMYWKVEYQTLPYIKQFLRTLRDALSVSLYVATEGHHDTQLNKLRVVRLDDFFSDLCIMSTGAAATPAEHVRSINNLISEFKGDLVYAKKEAETFEKSQIDRIQKLVHDEYGQVNAHVIEQDQIVKVFSELLRRSQEKKEQLEQKRDYLEELYKKQWNDYAEKQEGYIYSLIIACIMADPERPYVYLTNLQQLVLALQGLPHGYQGLSLAMIGDREKKDIGPLLRLLERGGCPPNAVTTMRLLTWDHRNESLYWRQEQELGDRPLARYVAWNPLQSLLLLASKYGWPTEGLTYRRLPPIVNARLFGGTGAVNEHNWNAMVWGEARKEETYTLMNYFITESTVRANAGGIAEFADVLHEKIVQAGKDPENNEHRFAWVTLTRFLANAIAIGECRLEVATVIRDTVCDEIRHGRVIGSSDYGRIAVDMLDTLSGRGQTPFCTPPRGGDHGLTDNVPFGERARLQRVLEKWPEAAAQHGMSPDQ